MIGPTNGRTQPATAPAAAPTSTGLVEGWCIPSLAMPTISSRMSSTRSGSSCGSLCGSLIALSPGIDGEGGGQLADPAAHAFFHLRIAVVAILRQAVNDFGDQRSDLAEL